MNLMNEFWTSIVRDPQLEAYWEKKENLELTQEEGWEYIDRLSDFAVDALQKTLNTETLPDGILYWNIAQAVIPDFLREVSDMIYEIQVATWKKEDLEMGINAGFQLNECAEISHTCYLAFYYVAYSIFLSCVCPRIALREL